MLHCGTQLIETPRMILRRFSAADAESCLKNWAADMEIYRYISQQPQSADEVEQWLAGADEAYASCETYYWAVVERESAEVIGEIFVDDFSERSRRCELDWKIGSAYAGRGLATEAAGAVVRYLTEKVGFHRVQAKCSVENRASERVMQKLGMEREGVMREFFRDDQGIYHDVVIYALII